MTSWWTGRRAYGALMLFAAAAAVGPTFFQGAIRDYRAGSEALRAGRLDEAVVLLAGASARLDEPAVRAHALHDLALAELERAGAAATAEARERSAAASVEAAREALRLDPSATATRWNLALAETLLRPEDETDRILAALRQEDLEAMQRSLPSQLSRTRRSGPPW